MLTLYPQCHSIQPGTCTSLEWGVQFHMFTSQVGGSGERKARRANVKNKYFGDITDVETESRDSDGDVRWVGKANAWQRCGRCADHMAEGGLAV